MIYEADSITVNTDTRQTWTSGEAVRLTPTEFTLLVYLMTDPTRVFSYEQIERDVLGYAVPGKTQAVAAHAARLRRKLGRPDVICARHHFGYSLLSPRPARPEYVPVMTGEYATRAMMRVKMPHAEDSPQHGNRISIVVPHDMSDDDCGRWVRAAVSTASRHGWIRNARERLKDCTIRASDMGEGVRVIIVAESSQMAA